MCWAFCSPVVSLGDRLPCLDDFVWFLGWPWPLTHYLGSDWRGQVNALWCLCLLLQMPTPSASSCGRMDILWASPLRRVSFILTLNIPIYFRYTFSSPIFLFFRVLIKKNKRIKTNINQKHLWYIKSILYASMLHHLYMIILSFRYCGYKMGLEALGETPLIYSSCLICFILLAHLREANNRHRV